MSNNNSTSTSNEEQSGIQEYIYSIIDNILTGDIDSIIDIILYGDIEQNVKMSMIVAISSLICSCCVFFLILFIIVILKSTKSKTGMMRPIYM